MTSPLILPLVAEHIAKSFPDLNGRAVAVMDPAVTEENMPKLPLVMVAPNKEDADHKFSSNGNIVLDHSFVAAFWLPSIKYKNADGSELPFWAYYDYETLRDQFITVLLNIRFEGMGRFEYMGLEVDATEFSTTVLFKACYHTRWCEPDVDEESAGDISFSLFPASDQCEETCEQEKDDTCL